MADASPQLPMYSGFKGIPTPEQLGMGMNPYRAFGLLRKAAKSVHKPTKAYAGGLRGGNVAKATRGHGKVSTGGKK